MNTAGSHLLCIDIGSTTVKAVVIDVEDRRILWSDYRRHETRQAAALEAQLSAIESHFIWGIGPRIAAQLREAGLSSALDVAHMDAATVRRRWSGGPLIFSAITGGTQSEHWRGGGNGRSLISLGFLFTFKTWIRGVNP